MADWNAKIHILPANAGDCFLIEFNNNECILIDTGFKETYYKYLKPLLMRLKNKGKKITLLVITHIDKDHIGGAKKLLEENGDYNTPNIIKIENVWFNGFKNLVFQKKSSNTLNQKQLDKMRIIKAYNRMNYIDEMDNNVSANDLKAFEIICNELNYPINRQFIDNTVIQSENIEIGSVSIDVISPNKLKIEKYTKYLEKQLEMLFGKDYEINKNEEFMTFFETLMLNDEENIQTTEPISYQNEEDIADWLKINHKNKIYSIVNDVSIGILIKFDDIKMLFTGDIYFEKKYINEKALIVDVLKVPHHGSYWNNCEIMKNFIANNYIISTDGKKYGHPDKNILANIITNNKQNKTMIFNYEIDSINILKNQEQKDKYNYEYIIGNELII